MVSIIFGLGTALFFAASTLLSSRATKIIGPWSVVAWVSLTGLVAVAPFAALDGVPTGLSGSNVTWWIISGAGNVLGLVLTAIALRVGKVGVIAPIVATEGAIAAVIAAILGESIAPLVAFLLLVIVVGVVLAAAGKDPAPIAHERPLLAVLLSTAAAASFGVALYATGSLSDELPISWVLLPSRTVGVLAILIPLVMLRKLSLTKATAPLVIAMGLTEVLGFTSYAIGAQYEVAITSVLASQFAPIAAVLAYILFRERLGRQQVLGVVVIVLGVAVLTAVTA